MDVRCQCGSVHFKTPLDKPLKVYHCHCSECRRQSASAFGTTAGFPVFELPLDSQPIALFTRPAADGGTMDCYFCKNCGSRLVHRSRDVQGQLGKTCSVKGGVIEGLDWTGAEHIYCDDMVVKSIAIPDGVKAWARDDDEGVPFVPKK